MFGLALKADWSTDPVTIIQTNSEDHFTDGMPVNPNAAAASWPKAAIKVIREIQIKSTETGRLRAAFVVRK